MRTTIITVNWDECHHITEASYYNSNYFIMPFQIDGCDILHESYDGGDYFNGYSVGVMDENKFHRKFYLNTDAVDGGFQIDTSRISEENLFT